MVESINEYSSFNETVTIKPKPPSKNISLTKTIRFSKEDKDLWEHWNKDTVVKVKQFIREQLTYKQVMESQIKKAENPISEKQRLLKEKLDKIKFMLEKERF